MDTKKALLLKSLGELLIIALVTTTNASPNASYRYPRGRDQNEFKLTLH